MLIESDTTWLSFLPAIIAIVLAVYTRQVMISLLAGIFTGSGVLIYLSGDWQYLNVFKYFFYPALYTTTFRDLLIIYVLCLGVLLGLWSKTGGAEYFSTTLGKKFAKGPRSAMFFGWVIGLIFHQGGTISTVLAGTTLKPITDQHRISHEELAYLVDSTASPVATLIPLNAWPIYVSNVVAGIVPFLPDKESAYHFFMTSIPYNFYALIAVFGTLLFGMGLIPWSGKHMQEAIIRSRTTGQLDHFTASPLLVTSQDCSKRDATYKPNFLDFLGPLLVLLAISIIPFLLWKKGTILYAFIGASITSIVISLLKGLPLKSLLGGIYNGWKSLFFGMLILALAITVGHVTQQLNASGYLVDLLAGNLPPLALPAILTLLCMGIAFATGTSLGTYAVVFPVALPLAYSLHPDPFYLHVCFGAVLGGAVFGDQCSPISDTTIFSCMFTGCDLTHHVRSQFPLALGAAGLGILASTSILFFA